MAVSRVEKDWKRGNHKANNAADDSSDSDALIMLYTAEHADLKPQPLTKSKSRLVAFGEHRLNSFAKATLYCANTRTSSGQLRFSMMPQMCSVSIPVLR